MNPKELFFSGKGIAHMVAVIVEIVSLFTILKSLMSYFVNNWIIFSCYQHSNAKLSFKK